MKLVGLEVDMQPPIMDQQEGCGHLLGSCSANHQHMDLIQHHGSQLVLEQHVVGCHHGGTLALERIVGSTREVVLV